MTKMEYPKFTKELKNHDAPGYHATIIKHNKSVIEQLCNQLKWQIPNRYIDFLTSIGSGRFFGGSLDMFPFIESEAYSVVSVTKKIIDMGTTDKFAFGYDGTTQGVLCLSLINDDNSVYWIEWAGCSVKIEANDFTEWIESISKELFSKKIYAGYKQIKDFSKINSIIEKRKLFTIELESYEKELNKPPDKSNDFLPRYNKLNLKVTKHDSVDLDFFTIKCHRSGSPVGKDNIEYVTIAVKELPVSVPTILVSWLFDPFNMPFEKIFIQADPFVDLSSKMRVKYQEIKDYL